VRQELGGGGREGVEQDWGGLGALVTLSEVDGRLKGWLLHHLLFGFDLGQGLSKRWF
jgi:hypothetical protein